jgi:predicted nucleic acid-binding protein
LAKKLSPRKTRIYMDSSVLIAAFNAEATTSEDVRKAIEQTLIRMTKGEVEVVSSDALIRTEVLNPAQKRALELLLGCPYFEAVLLSAEVGDKAAELRLRCLNASPPRKLKTPDAQHLATAILSKCDEFWTTDGDLLKWAAAGLFSEIPVREPSLEQRVLFVH